jgi:DNA-binding protein
VDIAEVVRNRFVPDVKRTVDIGTDEVKDNDGRNLKVSTIDIVMKK